LIWSLSRVLRAVGGIYEAKLFYGMLLGLEDQQHNTYLIPMMLIVMFLLIEIAPFMFVLDPSFMEIFVLKPFPESLTEPLNEFERPVSFASRYSVSQSLRLGSIKSLATSDRVSGEESLVMHKKSDNLSNSARAINESNDSEQDEQTVELVLHSESDFQLLDILFKKDP